MKYYNTKHEKNATRITILILLIVFLIMFFVGPPYLDPPEEYGVAVNFGTTDFGSGNQVLANPIKSEISEVTETTQSTSEQESTPDTSSKVEELMTQESEESIAIKKQKAAEAERQRIEREKQKAEEKKRIEQEAKIKNLDNIIGGVKNAKGKDKGDEGDNSDSPGNKGQLNGNPYAPSYFGGSGNGNGGVGSGLNGRGKPTKQIFKQDCNEYGLVVVKIEVNRQGKVISATPGIKGSTNTHPCLLGPAKKVAESHKWPSDLKAPSRQIGFVSVNFTQNN